MKRLALPVLLLVTLALSPAAGAVDTGGSCGDPVCGSVAYTTDGWRESTFDEDGLLLSVRSGTGAEQPYGETFTDEDKGIGSGTGEAPLTSGCRDVDWYESGHSFLGALLYRFHQVKRWCWNYPHIGNVTIGTYIDHVESCCIVYRGLAAQYGWYYTWRGDAHGGHYARRMGQVDNCVAHYGCIHSWYPWVDIWVNGNGAWLGDDGGGG